MRPAPHDSTHRTLLEALLGEPEPSLAFEASELAACDECRAELAQLLRARELLETIGRDRAEDLALAERIESPLPKGHVRAMLAGELEGAGGGVAPAARADSPRPRRGSDGGEQGAPGAEAIDAGAGRDASEPDRSARPPVWRWWVAATAAALALWFARPPERPVDPLEDWIRMGADSEHIVTPIRPGDPLDHFEWVPHPAAGATYRVHLYDADRPAEPLASSAILRGECTWDLDLESLALDGVRRMYWTLEISLRRVDEPDETYTSPVIER